MSDYVNHVVVCGYDESTHILLDALRRELDLMTQRVVIFDDNVERPLDLPPEFLWVQGDQTKESELDKVRLTQSAAVIVYGARDMPPQVADARTILTTFTIRSFMKRQKQDLYRISPLYVVAEILDSENVDHALTAGADEVIETRKIGYSMIAHAVHHHGTATTMSRVLISGATGAHSVFIGQIPDEHQQPELMGDLLVRMELSKRGGLVIGIRTPSGKEIINPPKNQVVVPGTLLIYLAEKPLLKTPS